MKKVYLSPKYVKIIFREVCFLCTITSNKLLQHNMLIALYKAITHCQIVMVSFGRSFLWFDGLSKEVTSSQKKTVMAIAINK